MNWAEEQYLDLLEDILVYGESELDRTGVGTRAISGATMKFDLREGFPAITTKKLAFKSVVGELLWMLSGSTNERDLCEITFGTRDPNKKTIWTANANDPKWLEKSEFTDSIGLGYGHQWRHWSGWDEINKPTDQIQSLIDSIKTNPTSRRHIVTAWRPDQLHLMALPPCHILFQVHIRAGKYLDLTLYQRSGDVFLGIPFNIAFYSLLMHILAAETGYEAREFTHFIADAHIYNNHVDQVKTQLDRNPFQFPQLEFEKKSFFNYKVDDFKLINYEYHPAITAEMAL